MLKQTQNENQTIRNYKWYNPCFFVVFFLYIHSNLPSRDWVTRFEGSGTWTLWPLCLFHCKMHPDPSCPDTPCPQRQTRVSTQLPSALAGVHVASLWLIMNRPRVTMEHGRSTRDTWAVSIVFTPLMHGGWGCVGGVTHKDGNANTHVMKSSVFYCNNPCVPNVPVLY